MGKKDSHVHIGKTGLIHTNWQTPVETTESLNRQIREERANKRPFVPRTILRKAGDRKPEERPRSSRP